MAATHDRKGGSGDPGDVSRPWTRDRTPVADGKAEILRTKASNGYWQFRCFIPEEKKYVRKSLRTRDKESAKELAVDEYLKILQHRKNGTKIFGTSVRELVDAFLEHKERHVTSGAITPARHRCLATHLKHMLEFVQETNDRGIRVSELHRRALFDYQHFRRSQGAADVTIRNEQATINAMATWGYKNGYCSFPQFDFDVIRIREAGRRDTFTPEEYETLVRYMRSWVAKKNNSDPIIRKERELIRDLIFVLSNTLLRVGEAKRLRWRDVISVDYSWAGQEELPYPLVYIRVPREISKTRKSRDVIARGGQYFRRLRKRQDPKSKEAFVFPNPEDELKPFSVRKLYSYWEELMGGVGIDYKSRNITYYSLRHFGITERLGAGVNIWDVATIAGTSVAYIEKHYGHASHHMMTLAAAKKGIRR